MREIHRKLKLISGLSTDQQRRWLKRRQAIEPAIGHLKSDNRLDRCPLKGQLGDALHAVLCATGYNLRWLMRAMTRLGLSAFLFRLLFPPIYTALARSVLLSPLHFNPKVSLA